MTDLGIQVLSSKSQSKTDSLNHEYLYFLRSKFDYLLANNKFEDIKKVFHHKRFATLYFARNSELITRFVAAVLSSPDVSNHSILIDECSAGFRRVIFRSLFRLGLTGHFGELMSFSSDSDKNPFEIAYKIAVSQGDYQTAATTMFLYAQRIRFEVHSVKSTLQIHLVTALSFVKSLYGRSLASLKLIENDDNSKWILNTPSNSLLPFNDGEDEDEGSKDEENSNEYKRSFDGNAITLDMCKYKMFGPQCLWDDDSCYDVITVDRLERVLITSTCEYSLAKKCGVIVNSTVKDNWRTQLVEVLVKNDLIDDAFLLGKAYPELNVHIFELLKNSVIDPNELVIGEKVHDYLKRLNKTDYYRVVLCGILNDNQEIENVMVVDGNDKLAAVGGNSVTIPWWLIKEMLGVCPSELFKILLEFSLFNLIDRTLDLVSKGDIPYLQLEAIVEEFKRDQHAVDSAVKNSILKKLKSLISK